MVEFVAAAHGALGAEVKEIRLFGSRARGEGDADSDLDLAVIVTAAGRARRHELHDLAFDVGLRHRITLSPMVIDQQLLAELRDRERLIAIDIDRDGITL